MMISVNDLWSDVHKVEQSCQTVQRDSISFPIKPLSSISTAKPTNWLSNTSADSGFDSPPNLSPLRLSANAQYSH